MDETALCLGCMQDSLSSNQCPLCGWSYTIENADSFCLPLKTRLHERYLTGRVLGTGGFAITYLAWDTTLKIRVAIKEFLPRDIACRSRNRTTVSPYSGEASVHFNDGIDKFLEEARTLARFQEHPGIVSIIDFFKANGTGYLVMPYVEGVTLKEYLKTHGDNLPYQLTVDMMMPVMDALREVHNAGILHRDISPDNIYVTLNKQIKLLDFGAARQAIGENTRSLTIVLKPGYAPEEQYRSRGKHGPWTDIYAVAATMYRCITGKTPPESLDRLNEDCILSPTQQGVQVPLLVEATMMKALSTQAGSRYQTMEEFQVELINSCHAVFQSDKSTAEDNSYRKNLQTEHKLEQLDDISQQNSDTQSLSQVFELHTLWRGGYSLLISFWVFNILLVNVFKVIIGMIAAFVISIRLSPIVWLFNIPMIAEMIAEFVIPHRFRLFHIDFGFLVLVLLALLVMSFDVICMVGVWRSSERYSGPIIWRALAKTYIIIYVFLNLSLACCVFLNK